MRDHGSPAEAGVQNPPSHWASVSAVEPSICDRRAFMAAAAALAAFPAIAARQQPPKIAAINWPGPSGLIHGHMAIPGRAKGAQPAVLVVHDAGGADDFTRRLTDQLAEAGFVACAPTRLASLADGLATVKWLAGNAYATGRVAAIGLGWGGALVERIASARPGGLSGIVTFGAGDAIIAEPTPALRLGALGGMSAEAYADAWSRTIAFLKEHLA